jgi:nodulation protein E
MKRRVAITGIGCISALGENAESFGKAVLTGQCGIGPLTVFPTERNLCKIAAECSGYSADAWFSLQEAQRLDRFAQFGVIAGREAMRRAGQNRGKFDGERAAVIMGACIGGLETMDAGYRRLLEQRQNKVHPLSVPMVMPSAAVSCLSTQFGILGPCFAITSACSSASHAIAIAFDMVRSGKVDLAMTGGSDASLTFGMVKAWEGLRVLAPDTCRPFSQGRQGLVLGEGGAALVLEPLDLARLRGAHIYAELLGAGMSADAFDLTLPNPEGGARAMSAALSDAGLEPDQVDYLNAHGTGTLANDISETRAIREVFGVHVKRLAVSSTKSMHGHTLGAAGALEAVATIVALQQQVAPPTMNFIGPDPECDLDVVHEQPRPMPIRLALSNSFAFGGLNAVLAFRKAD